MSYYAKKIDEARQTDLCEKRFLTDFEGAAYLSIGRTAFRKFAEKIGCRRKIGRRTVNDRIAIDEALQRGDGV